MLHVQRARCGHAARTWVPSPDGALAQSRVADATPGSATAHETRGGRVPAHRYDNMGGAARHHPPVPVGRQRANHPVNAATYRCA
eukprot:4981996-Alexandrium_andersonii.AAC.1